MKYRSILSLLVLFLIQILQLSAHGMTSEKAQIVIHRYMFEWTFSDGLYIPMDIVGSDRCLTVVSNDAEDNTTWVHSYITKDMKKTFCIYDVPSPEAIRKSAKVNRLPVDNVI